MSFARSLARSGVTKQDRPVSATPVSYWLGLLRSCGEEVRVTGSPRSGVHRNRCAPSPAPAAGPGLGLGKREKISAVSTVPPGEEPGRGPPVQSSGWSTSSVGSRGQGLGGHGKAWVRITGPQHCPAAHEATRARNPCSPGGQEPCPCNRTLAPTLAGMCPSHSGGGGE